MLKLENLSKYYYSGNNVVLALRKIDLEFKTGEFVAITGESGSGKSTLLNVLSGLDTYEDGKMYVNSDDISHYTINELEIYRKQYIGFVFQDYNIIDSYTVFQNIELALIVQGYEKKLRRARVFELIEQVGLTSVANQKASKCSGGEKQRTVIARALAKDCSIIVCDEPTGNLDKKSSENILKLLHGISSEKLVIVVTHNFEEIKEFATRKVRLYDGEIVEDQIIGEEENLIDSFVKLNEYKTNFFDILKISLINILSVPKKTFFSWLIITLMILSFIFSYGLSLKEQNTSLDSNTPYFENAFAGRVIITKRDESPFSIEELINIKEIDFIREIVKYDIVFDSVYLSAVHNEELGFDEFIPFKVLPSESLNEFDLSKGRLPKNEYEVVIGENDYYQIDDYISISNEEIIRKTDGAITEQYTYKIVGVIEQNVGINGNNELYFHIDALDTMHNTALYETSQKYLVVDNKASYAITQDIRIDNTLGESVVLAYDMMFFDICRDFGYRIDIIDDFDAGLCDSRVFIDAHDFSINAFTKHEDLNDPYEIVLDSVPIYPHLFGQGLYMNRNTFNAIFEDDVYQPSVIVYDMFEANQVKSDLEALGYNVFYPNGVINEDDAVLIIVRNLQLSLTLGLTLVVVYFVGYFVMRNVIVSKKKDYLVYRSVGASKKTINGVLITEIMYLTILSFIVVMGALMINELIDSPIPRLLRYFNYYNYISILVVISLVMFMMSHNFNSRIFGKSVISSLKAQ